MFNRGRERLQKEPTGEINLEEFADLLCPADVPSLEETLVQFDTKELDKKHHKTLLFG
jgi:hypothetical protein